MQSFFGLPWYTYVEDNEKIPIKPLLKEMIAGLPIQDRVIPMADDWFMEVMHQNECVYLLPSKEVDGVIRSREVSKKTIADAVLQSRDNQFHFTMSALAKNSHS